MRALFSAYLACSPAFSAGILLAHNGPQAQVAIPLSDVARLERFPASVLRRSGQREVMEYWGHVIPVLRLSQEVPAAKMAQPSASGNTLETVIYTEQGRIVGVIVDRILDIVNE